MMTTRKLAASVAFTLALPIGAVAAADLVYAPVNPSFGGNALNSTHLFGGANAQRTATASDANDNNRSSGTVTGTDGTSTIDFDLFTRQLQSRLLSALSSQVTAAIFGDDAQDTGTVDFGDQSVNFTRTSTEIEIIITDINDPTNPTVIRIPQLVTTTGAATTPIN